MAPAYMSHGSGVLIVVRSEHRVDLRSLTLALYHSNATLGEELAASAVRRAVARVFEEFGSDVVFKVSGYITGARSFDEGSLVGSDVDKRLEWARQMVLKTYRRDFSGFPNDLKSFAALPVGEIV
ncbi:hypothetical protein [Streptomyces sp. NPDC059761]|uniref:hypothetical protein n=1 Tax=Streptomyces sp. NPDC059761 TaxID=3346937 RepID=UPI00365FDE92